MSVWERIKRLWGGTSGAIERSEAKGWQGDTFTVLVRPDGFVHSANFDDHGDGLFRRLYTATAWSFACTSANSKAAASLPWTVQEPTSRARNRWIESERRSAVPLFEILADPMRGSETAVPLGWQELVQLTILHMYIGGDAYWRLRAVAKRTKVQRIEVLNPEHVRKVFDERGRLVAYEVQRPGLETVEIKPRDVVHFVNPNPSSTVSGVAHYEAAQRGVKIDRIGIDRVVANLENRIAPGLIMTIRGGEGLSPRQRDEFVAYLQDQYSKSTQDGAPLVVGQDAEIIATPDQSHQIDFSQIQGDARARIVAVYGTPPPVIGDYEQATLQNFDAAFRVWWITHLLPLLQCIAGAVNRQLVWPIYGRDFRLWYDLSGTEVGLILLGAKATVAQQIVDLGYPPSVAAAKVGLDLPSSPELERPNQQLIRAGRETS